MMQSNNEVDDLIENEVCNRLIRLSCAKMVNSRSERGGAKLHKNLLILHLLRKARDEQKRFTSFLIVLLHSVYIYISVIFLCMLHIPCICICIRYIYYAMFGIDQCDVYD